MATPVIMPRQGQSVESCIITEWFKQKGDAVAVGDVLFSYETDKASFEEEAKEAGTLLEIFFGEEEDVPVLTTVAVIGAAGEDTSEFQSQAESTSELESTQPTAELSTEAQTDISTETEPELVTTGRQKISPRAKNLAIQGNVDPRQAKGTGPEGRVIERDVQQLITDGPKVTQAAKERYLEALEPVTGTGIGGRITTKDLEQPKPLVSPTDVSEPVNDYQDIKLSNMRKVIAKAMLQSITTTAQLTLNSSFDATAILAYRQELKSKQEEQGLENITINDIILYAVSRTLPAHPELNAHFFSDSIRIFSNTHLGIAVDTERGLMVPTLFDANRKSLNQISKDMKQLVADCQKGSINPDNLQGATFTITNLGTLGIESFTPVLNPPQTGILGVNTIEYKARNVSGDIAHYPAMGLSLTFDHRALDGAPAARFLQDLCKNLESFQVLLAK